MKTTLSDIILDEIREKGPIPFSRYMELCLYHPDLGYYQRSEFITGPSGDFYTAPHVHALFGQTVGNTIGKMSEEMDLEEVTVLELGPGNGQLAQDILDAWNDKRRPLSLILVEESGPGKRDLEARFEGRPVRVLSPSEVDNLEPFKGAVLANEFFDALPLRIFASTDNGIMEAFVAQENGCFTEELLPVNEIPEGFDEILDDLPLGYRVEISSHWKPWITKTAHVLSRGRLFIIDYGEFTDGLVVPWRMGGTLRCFRRHQVDTEPYENPGEKDITAHVNFSLLKGLALEAGFSLRSYTSQASFLIKSGILEMLAKQMETLPEREATGLWLTVKNLVHDEGMGEIFKVMVLEKEEGMGNRE
jgi:SAM-dependent MidA family methyltransferase